MTYYLKDHVTDEMLVAVGFEIITNSWGYKWAVRNPFEDTKTVAITLHNIVPSEYRCVFTFPFNAEITDKIKDLIELGYVEEMK